MNEYLDHIFDEIDSQIKLDNEQKKVVLTDGDIEVVAGAGSGKTTTMVAKVKYLIDIQKVAPEQILLISYTNKATEELKARIQQDFHLPISIFTFHKLGLEILKGKKKMMIKTETTDIITQIMKEISQKSKWRFYFWTRKYRKKSDFSRLISLSETFIKNYKMNGKPSIDCMHLSCFWKKYLKQLLYQYQEKMQQNHWIDFEDMILESTKLIRQKKVQFPYQYVIVDEYQDISKDRFLLLKAIKEEYQVTIIVVGDDWQSIFGFSGSDMGLFIEFKRFFSTATILKITNTYRNSQELIDIAGAFVMKNKFQVTKQLSSNKHLDNPIQLISYRENRQRQLEKILDIISIARAYSTVFLLGRYHSDFNIKEFPFLTERKNKIIDLFHSNLKIEFLTVHSSKGLSADEVIILNGSDDIYGFPTKKKTDPILKQVETIDLSYPFAEERRLFYVALTRTKNYVYILYPKKRPSIFLTEISKYCKK